MNGPEIRLDQLTGMRVLIAPGRSDRPEAMGAPEREVRGPEGCPFCEGHEDRTPPELFAIRPEGEGADTPGWQVRSVPNLFPALAPSEGRIEGGSGGATAGQGGTTAGANERAGAGGTFSSPADPLRASARSGETDLFSSRPAIGSHEVIISSPRHVTSLADLDSAELASVVGAWRERMRHHSRAAYCQLIVNEGRSAGASLEHTHAQLYALSFVPAAVARERERASSYAERTAGGNLLLDVLVEEVRRDQRLVAIDEDAALICPWASRSPYEMRLIPRRSEARFEESEAGVAMLGTALRLLKERFGHIPALNMWLRTAPRGVDQFQWHIDLAPRLTSKAGFEFGTEIDINVVAPENAAAELRRYL